MLTLRGQFDYYHDAARLFGMDKLPTADFSTTLPDTPLVGQWKDDTKLLNYPLVEARPFNTQIFDLEPEQPSETDLKVTSPLKDL